MKRYGNLFEKIVTKENILAAHIKARKGKSHYREVKYVNQNIDKCITDIMDCLINKNYKCSDYEIITKKCGEKIREIYKLPYYPDRIIHHAIMNIMEPIWVRTLIYDTYSSIKGRGIHKGVARIKRALKDFNNTRFCLKLDIKKFYPSVNNTILKQIIRKKVKDHDLLWLLDEIIDKEKGLPIGNLLSQMFGNLYLSGFDHYCKEVLKIRYYFRYCDDIVVLASEKQFLHECFKKMREYLNDRLKLSVKSNYQVFPVDARGIDFLGYRFFHGYTLLRKRIKLNMIKALKEGNKKAIPSYTGWMKHANCFNLKNKYFNESTSN
ncbi:reverse transcriptase domain-containing protein [Thermophagus sp. OGC60D27]|uniref:reverse transcriptase domain-containing protein n=1 Tax=Thermophagus sp. OGC60D27 TaxID=3458415 RepID=UPI004038000D